MEGLEGNALHQALTQFLGVVAAHAEVSFDGVIVNVVRKELGEADASAKIQI